MSFLGRLFGTEKALDTVVKSVSNGLDALVYTDQEKAESANKERSEARQMVVQWMEATKGQNLARRLIALSITGTWLGQYVLSQVCSLLSVILTDDRLVSASQVLSNGANDMNSPVMLILAFYFSAPYMGQIIDKVGKKHG